MNFRQIDCFRSVMLYGSMSAAARQLGVSQSMVSRSIAGLEQEMGIPLFRRENKGIHATAAAVALYNEVQRSFRGLDVIEQAAREIRETGRGRLQVVSIPVIAEAILPEAMAIYMARDPRAQLAFDMRSEITAFRYVSSGVCDVGFSSIKREAFNVEIQELYSLSGVCAVPKRHALASRARLTLQDLVEQRLILPPKGDVIRVRVDALFAQHRLQVAPVVETPYAASTCALADDGIGIGIVNPLAMTFGDHRNLRFVPLDESPIYNGYLLTKHRACEQREALFIEAVFQVLREKLDRIRRWETTREQD